jgi:hypothetical protein
MSSVLQVGYEMGLFAGTTLVLALFAFVRIQVGGQVLSRSALLHLTFFFPVINNVSLRRLIMARVYSV